VSDVSGIGTVKHHDAVQCTTTKVRRRLYIASIVNFSRFSCLLTHALKMFAPTKKVNGGPKSLAPYEFDDKDPGNLKRRAVDDSRRIKVICIGAGMSGILTGILFPRSIENLDLVIYDKNPDLGGTWYESRYVRGG
jgi:hypothetical protein